MSRFLTYKSAYTSGELAIFEEAYRDACRKLDVEPYPSDESVHTDLRADLANAIMDAARFGERDVAILSARAVNFGLRNLHPPKR
jgi:hypothetical protein